MLEKADFNALFQKIIAENKEAYEKWLKEKEETKCCVSTRKVGD